VTHSADDTLVSGDAAENKIPDASDIEEQLEICVLKCAPTRFVDDWLIENWPELINDVVASLTTNEKTSQWSESPYLGVDEGTSKLLLARQRREVCSMAFSGVVDLGSCCSKMMKESLDAGNDLLHGVKI